MANTALVIGGGIGGLTAAVALREAGWEVRIHERARELHPVGAGITMQCNALRALAHLGLDRAVREAGSVMRRGTISDPRGRVLSRMVPPSERLGQPQIAIHRAELQDILLGAAGARRVSLGARCVGYEADAQGVTARFEDGREDRGELLIGADGIHSAVRAQLLGEVPVRYSGYTCWRGVCPRGELVPDGEVDECWGPGRRFGTVPIGGDRIYWFATHDAPAGGTDGGAAKATLRALFGGFHAPIPAVIEATEESAILRNDIVDRPPSARWGEGRVTLLGDAAHPMTPNMGQGGCQAVEDAVVLGHLLRDAADPVAALRAYEAKRIPRVSPIVTQSYRIGAVAQWSSGPARWLRDLGVRMTGRFAAASLDELWAFEPTA